MGYGEVFTALQTGVIDGAENNPPSLFTANHFQAGAKYYTQTNHLIIPEILVMSKVTWDKLTPGRPGAGEEARARGADGAARAVGQERGRLHRPSSRRPASSSSRSTTSPSSTPPRRCAPSTARQFADLIKRIEAVK